MGRSQFFEGDFQSAAATFAYMSRLYATQPGIYGKARAWLAKSYLESGWIYDAEDVIRNIERDSIHCRAPEGMGQDLCPLLSEDRTLSGGRSYLRKAIGYEMRRKQKARLWYLMGQVEAQQGHTQNAYRAFKHVIRLNPPYELEFNALHLHDRGTGNQQLPEDGIQIEANGCERQEPGVSRPGLLCHRQHTSQPGRYPSGYCCIRKGCCEIKPKRS